MTVKQAKEIAKKCVPDIKIASVVYTGKMAGMNNEVGIDLIVVAKCGLIWKVIVWNDNTVQRYACDIDYCNSIKWYDYDGKVKNDD